MGTLAASPQCAENSYKVDFARECRQHLNWPTESMGNYAAKFLASPNACAHIGAILAKMSLAECRNLLGVPTADAMVAYDWQSKTFFADKPTPCSFADRGLAP